MSQAAVIGPSLATLSGVLRIALFEENELDARASLVGLPGDRVETNALLMPASPSWAPPSTVTSVGDALVTPPAAEPLVTFAAAWAALLAVLVIAAGAAAMASVVALGFPT